MSEEYLVTREGLLGVEGGGFVRGVDGMTMRPRRGRGGLSVSSRFTLEAAREVETIPGLVAVRSDRLSVPVTMSWPVAAVREGDRNPCITPSKC